MGLERLL
jgi:hypothetical protein